jgi:hypothetical protein
LQNSIIQKCTLTDLIIVTVAYLSIVSNIFTFSMWLYNQLAGDLILCGNRQQLVCQFHYPSQTIVDWTCLLPQWQLGGILQKCFNGAIFSFVFHWLDGR